MREDCLKLAVVVGLAGSMALLGAGTASADPPEHWREGHEVRGHDFHGRDFGHFRPEELALWRGGHWIHDWHGGRFGWWWFADGFWYFYPQPIYPYPTYVAPVVVEEAPPAPPGPPPRVVAPQPIQPQAQAQAWYYCDNPRGYYPYVQSCPTPWRAVPAAPPPGSAPEAAPPPQAPYGPPAPAQ